MFRNSGRRSRAAQQDRQRLLGGRPDRADAVRVRPAPSSSSRKAARASSSTAAWSSGSRARCRPTGRTCKKLEAETKAYLKAGDRETAAKFALELQKAKEELAANEEQLQMHETAYENNLKKIQHANSKLVEVREKIQKYDAELKMSAAEAEIAKLVGDLQHERHHRLRPDRAGDPAQDRPEPRQGARRRGSVGRRASPRSRPKNGWRR